MAHDTPQPAETLQTAQTGADRNVPGVTRRVRKRPISKPAVQQPITPSGPMKLRLVGGAAAPDAKLPIANPTPITGATDPRWVLAIRTAESLQGDVLPPAKRDALMKTGKMMGLTPFDCSLILAIVQDRARRGIAPDQCPAAGEAQLALIPLPPMRSWFSGFTANPGQVVLLAAGMLALQALVLWIWLG